MSGTRLRLVAAAVLLLTSGMLGAAELSTSTQAPPAPGANVLTPEQARRAIELLEDDTKRGQIIDVLRAIGDTSPAAQTNRSCPTSG
jgi:hypothetical protein